MHFFLTKRQKAQPQKISQVSLPPALNTIHRYYCTAQYQICPCITREERTTVPWREFLISGGKEKGKTASRKKAEKRKFCSSLDLIGGLLGCTWVGR